MKRTSALGGMQQFGAPETVAKNVAPRFYLRLITSDYIQVWISLSPTSTRS